MKFIILGIQEDFKGIVLLIEFQILKRCRPVMDIYSLLLVALFPGHLGNRPSNKVNNGNITHNIRRNNYQSGMAS
jgi:hypothetical protein